MKDNLEIGAVIEFDHEKNNPTRRQFIKALGAFGLGGYGLKQAIGKVYGQEPEGEPLIYTLDIRGRPKKIKIVSRERYRRIQKYKEFPIKRFKEEYPFVIALRLNQRSNDPTDLVFQFIIDDVSKVKKQQLPSKIDGIPVQLEIGPADQYRHGGDSCDAAHEYQSPIEGGLAVNPGGGSSWGTSTFVGYSGSTYPAILSADHVMEGDRTMEQGGRKIAEYRSRSEVGTGQDITKYRIDPGISESYLTTFSDNVPTIEGAWTFQGLTDAGSMEVHISGANHCSTYNYTDYTVKSGSRCQFQVNFAYRQAGGGDSGGPWVDNTGDLVANHSGWVDPWWTHKRDVGGAAQESLDAVGVRLSPLPIGSHKRKTEQ